LDVYPVGNLQIDIGDPFSKKTNDTNFPSMCFKFSLRSVKPIEGYLHWCEFKLGMEEVAKASPFEDLNSQVLKLPFEGSRFPTKFLQNQDEDDIHAINKVEQSLTKIYSDARSISDSIDFLVVNIKKSPTDVIVVTEVKKYLSNLKPPLELKQLLEVDAFFSTIDELYELISGDNSSDVSNEDQRVKRQKIREKRIAELSKKFSKFDTAFPASLKKQLENKIADIEVQKQIKVLVILWKGAPKISSSWRNLVEKSKSYEESISDIKAIAFSLVGKVKRTLRKKTKKGESYDPLNIRASDKKEGPDIEPEIPVRFTTKLQPSFSKQNGSSGSDRKAASENPIEQTAKDSLKP